MLQKMKDAWSTLIKENRESESAAGTNQESAPAETVEHSVQYERRTDIPAGIYRDDMEPAYLDLSEKNVCLICCEERENGRRFLKRLEKTLSKKDDNLLIRLTSENCVEELANLAQQLNEKQKLLRKKSQEPDFNQEKWIQGYMQVCILIEDLPELAVSLEKEEMKRLSIIMSKSKDLGTVILISGAKEELKKQKNNVVVSTALRAGCVVIADGNPIEYTVLDNHGFPTYANTILDEDEAVLIQNDMFRFIRY
jgi:hypothetical protein